MFGTFTAQPGKRDDLAELLREVTRQPRPMPGCLAYIVYTVPDEPDEVGVFEVWESREAHRDSLQLDSVRRLIERARPLIAGPPDSVEIDPLAGLGMEPGS